MSRLSLVSPFGTCRPACACQLAFRCLRDAARLRIAVALRVLIVALVKTGETARATQIARELLAAGADFTIENKVRAGNDRADCPTATSQGLCAVVFRRNATRADGAAASPGSWRSRA